MKKNNKLQIRWDEVEGLIVKYPLGFQTVGDAHFIIDIINDEVAEELVKRGYDLTTLNFSIEVDLKSPKAKEKFPTLSEHSQISS